MKRAAAVIGILSVLMSCSANDRGNSPPLWASSAHPLEPATFDDRVAQANDVFLGTLVDVVDEVPFLIGRLPKIELRFKVERVLKGSALAGSTLSILQLDSPFGKAARVTSGEAGSRWLIVASSALRARSDDGSRDFVPVRNMFIDASYKRVQVDGTEMGIRAHSPYAREIAGYEGDRKTLVARVRDGKSIRPVDALPWSELLRRAAQPETDPDRQLGIDEVLYWIASQEAFDVEPPEEDEGDDNCAEDERILREEVEAGITVLSEEDIRVQRQKAGLPMWLC